MGIDWDKIWQDIKWFDSMLYTDKSLIGEDKKTGKLQINNPLKPAENFFEGVWDSIKSNASVVWDDVKWVGTKVEGVFDTVVDDAKWGWQEINLGVDTVWTDAKWLGGKIETFAIDAYDFGVKAEKKIVQVGEELYDLGVYAFNVAEWIIRNPNIILFFGGSYLALIYVNQVKALLK